MFLRLKQRGFFLFQMTIGLLTLPPSALTKKATVILYLNFFPSLHFFPFCASPLEGRALKKTTTFIHIPYISQLVLFTQFSKPFHPRANSYFSYIERLARYLHFTYAITKLPFIKPAFTVFKVIQIRIIQKTFDIHHFFFKQESLT